MLPTTGRPWLWAAQGEERALGCCLLQGKEMHKVIMHVEQESLRPGWGDTPQCWNRRNCVFTCSTLPMKRNLCIKTHPPYILFSNYAALTFHRIKSSAVVWYPALTVLPLLLRRLSTAVDVNCGPGCLISTSTHYHLGHVPILFVCWEKRVLGKSQCTTWIVQGGL